MALFRTFQSIINDLENTQLKQYFEFKFYLQLNKHLLMLLLLKLPLKGFLLKLASKYAAKAKFSPLLPVINSAENNRPIPINGCANL